MKLFICWAGELSKKVAKEFFDYLDVSPLHVDIKFSPEGIASGERWPSWLSETLEESHYGWLFMTKENLENRWIHFEAGNLGKDVNQSRVCPILIDISESELKPPLSHFQARQCNKDGVFKALMDLNDALGTDSVREETLRKSFEKYWEEISLAVSEAVKEGSVADTQPKRPEREILEEILTEVRRGSRRRISLARGSFPLTEWDDQGSDRPSLREQSDNWNLVALDTREYTTADGELFCIGDKVFNEANRDGVVVAIDDNLGGALVMFDNSTTALAEPLFIVFEELTVLP